MRLQPIISGLIIGGIGFGLQYLGFLENQELFGIPITYGIIGVGVLLILIGLIMRRRI